MNSGIYRRRKQCRGCRESKSFDQFEDNEWTSDGKGVYCNTCIENYRQRQLILRLPRICDMCGETFAPRSSNQKRCSPTCAQEALDLAGNQGRWIIFNRDNFQCIYCGKTAYGDRAQLHVDHIVPRSVGGEDVASNLVTSCIRCNLEKSAIELLDPNLILDEVARRNAIANIHPEKIIKV